MACPVITQAKPNCPRERDTNTRQPYLIDRGKFTVVVVARGVEARLVAYRDEFDRDELACNSL